MRTPNTNMFLSDLIAAADTGRSVFGQYEAPKTTAEAERWKEFNSFESKDHNTKTRDKLREEINNATHEIAVRRQAEMDARSKNFGNAYT